MGMRDELLVLTEWVVDRTRRRLDGLTDDELRWQPAPGSWTVRRLADGRAVVDNRFGPGPDIPPPSIAWRIAHLIEVYGAARNSRWLRVEGSPALTTAPSPTAPWAIAFDADGSRALLDEAMTHWTEVVTATSDDALDEPLGPTAGPWVEHTLAGFALHQLDEAIHHGAEVALLRDLHRHRPIDDSADLTADDLATHEDAVARAADLGRWDLVEALVLQGHRVDTPGRNALHHAAAIGDVAIVRLLLDHGADPAEKDPDFSGDALLWATYFERDEVPALLRERPAT